MTKLSTWKNFQKNFLNFSELGISLDTSLMRAPDNPPLFMQKLFSNAFQKMQELEKGEVANPDENRMVGHYWLRNPELAPSTEIQIKIKDTIKKIRNFAFEIHKGVCHPQKSDSFQNILLVGIGGSILGPQFLQNALVSKRDRMNFFFLDNTDPDGIDQVLESIGNRLTKTLTLVISKSGGTKETRNTMLEVRKAYKDAGLNFAKHAVAVTEDNSQLYLIAKNEGWLNHFPMWEWIGGRTSIFSVVGLLPIALQGIDIDDFLGGAKIMDEMTRSTEVRENPAAMLAWMWYHVGEGVGKKSLVMLPYKDKLLLLSRYLQQLVMESIGKEKDLEGKIVNQGLTVYGNKGSTDQHSFLQQLREGPSNFFVTFIEVLKDRQLESIEVEPGINSGDFLQGFLLGTRSALFEKGHESLCITIEDIDTQTLAALIALFERTVGIYAFLIGLNAYHQPGVEAGKKEAEDVIEILYKIQQHLKTNPGQQFTAQNIADAIGETEKVEIVFRLLLRLTANGRAIKIPHKTLFSSRFQKN